jgi:hypothetical protein
MPIIGVDTDKYYIIKRSIMDANTIRDCKKDEQMYKRLERTSTSDTLKNMFRNARVELESYRIKYRLERGGMTTRNSSVSSYSSS